MFDGLSKTKVALIVATMILLAVLTVWGGWTALHGYVMDGFDARRQL